MLNKTYHSKDLNYQYLWKSGFEICSNRVRSPSSQVWASEKPPKLCLQVYLHSIKPLKAQVIEISNAENVIFNKNLLHCTATPPKIMKMWVYKPLPSFLPDYIQQSQKNITGEAAQSGCFYSSCTVQLTPNVTEFGLRLKVSSMKVFYWTDLNGFERVRTNAKTLTAIW